MQEQVKATMGLNINPFTQAVHKAKTVTKGLGKTLGSALGLLGVGFALNRLATSIGDFADKLVDTSNKLGVSTDFLQAWNFAALQVGVSSETSNMALQRFTRRIGEAARGEGVLSKTITENNIALRDSDGQMRSTTDILGDYANVVRDAEGDQERLRLAFQAFDSEGAALVPMLANGAEGMQDMIDNARELNAVVSNQSLVSINRLTTRLRVLGTRGLGFVSETLGTALNFWEDYFAFLGAKSAGLSNEDAGAIAEEQVTAAATLAEKTRLRAESEAQTTAEKEKQVALEKQQIGLIQKQIDAQNALKTAKEDKTKSTVDKIAGRNLQGDLNAFFRKQRARAAEANALRDRARIVRARGGDASGLENRAGQLQQLIDLGAGITPRRVAEQQQRAQRIQDLEQYATELGSFGLQESAQLAMGMADRLRAQMGGLTSSERSPNAALEAAVAKSTTELQAVNTQIAEIKAVVKALNDP
tara:strand:+ start:419 stop:1843 length:1425 start_codon:yes stop_codon:yes gene_type:complete